MRDSCDSLSLAASATSCGDAPKWGIIISCFNGVSGNVDDGGKQAEEFGLLRRSFVCSTLSPMPRKANNSTVADATAMADTNLTNGLSVIANVAAAADPWCLNTDGSVCTPAARRMAKS